MDMAAQGFQVPPGTPYGSRLDIRCMQLHLRGTAKNCSSHGTGPAAQVNHNRRRRQCSVRQQNQGLIDQQFRAAPWHENAGLNHNAATGKLSPAQDVLQGNTLHTALDTA
jgi:hypothetical protein